MSGQKIALHKSHQDHPNFNGFLPHLLVLYLICPAWVKHWWHMTNSGFKKMTTSYSLALKTSSILLSNLNENWQCLPHHSPQKWNILTLMSTSAFCTARRFDFTLSAAGLNKLILIAVYINVCICSFVSLSPDSTETGKLVNPQWSKSSELEIKYAHEHGSVQSSFTFC